MKTSWVLSAAMVALGVSVVAGAEAQRTYTGCVQAANHGGMFLLTPIDSAMTTKADVPKAIVLTGASDLGKHVGQKVSVTGMLANGAPGTMRQDLSTLTVKTLKVVAKSCS